MPKSDSCTLNSKSCALSIGIPLAKNDADWGKSENDALGFIFQEKSVNTAASNM